MITKETTVTDKNGNEVPALLVLCPECGRDEFSIFVVNGHNHLQCLYCEVSFCSSDSECNMQ